MREAEAAHGRRPRFAGSSVLSDEEELAAQLAMAIYHQTTKMVKRSEGRNAVAAAAYRSGTELVQDATGQTHDYSKKVGVEHSEILAPEGAPDGCMTDRGCGMKSRPPRLARTRR